FCTVFACIASFCNQTNGYVVRDALFSNSGRARGSCPSHGEERAGTLRKGVVVSRKGHSASGAGDQIHLEGRKPFGSTGCTPRSSVSAYSPVMRQIVCLPLLLVNTSPSVCAVKGNLG